MENLKLTIELVPKTSWYSNVRTNVSNSEWDKIRKKCYFDAGYKCEVCGGVGLKHPVECHEIWEYDDVNYIQKLVGLIALCPNCHKTKHVGLAQINGEEDLVIKQLMNVNNINKKLAIKYIEDSFKLWRERSKHLYKIDIDYLKKYIGG